MRDVVLNIISVVVALAVAATVVICVGTSDGSLTDKVTMFSAIGAMVFAGVIFFTIFFFEMLSGHRCREDYKGTRRAYQV